LAKCQLFLTSRAAGGERLPPSLARQSTVNNISDFTKRDAAVEDEQRAKPEKFTDLLNLLENAPDGPVELDPSLLYSPTSSIHDDECSEAGLDRGNDANFNFFIPSTSAPPKQQQQLQQPNAAAGDENRALNERISHSKMRALQRIDDLRLEQQRAEMAECSFAPLTGRPPAGPRAAQIQLKVEDRLLLASNQRKNGMAKKGEQEREENERAACTFAPQLFPPRDAHLREKPHIPIYERLNEEWRKKQALLEQARAKANAEVSFKPQINPISVQLAEQRRFRTEAEKNKNEVHPGEKIPAGRGTTVEKGSTYFQTKINPVSQRILEMSSRVPLDFHRRQLHYLKKREENMQSLALEDTEEAKECSFKPYTGDTATKVLALSDTRFDQAIEGPEERWTRMAFTEAQLREEKLKLKEAEIRAEEATFQPQLNPRSLNIAEERKFISQQQQHVLYGSNGNSNNEAGMDFLNGKQASQRRRRESLATRDLKECTFFPNTSKPRVLGYYDEYEAPAPNAELSIAAALRDNPSGGGHDALLQRIEEHRIRKEQWAARVRGQEEKKQLAECTFAPIVNKTRPPADTTAVATVHETVAGMDRYLEVKAMAERKQAELDARAAKVFLLKPKSRGGVTVPKPFKLVSEARHAAKQTGL
jgi:hypothetical protein